MNPALEYLLYISSGIAGIVIAFIICYKLFIGGAYFTGGKS